MTRSTRQRPPDDAIPLMLPTTWPPSVETAVTVVATGTDVCGFGPVPTNVHAPYLVRRIVLAGTGPRGGRGYYLSFTTSPSSQAKGKEFVERIFTRRDGRDVTPTLASRDAQGEALLEWAVPDPSKLARLAAITQPTLVANGDGDRMIPIPSSYLLAGHLPNAQLVIYPDAGHGFLFQFPREFAAEVNRFLSEASPRRDPNPTYQ